MIRFSINRGGTCCDLDAVASGDLTCYDIERAPERLAPSVSAIESHCWRSPLKRRERMRFWKRESKVLLALRRRLKSPRPLKMH
jgi:hypothetical protein